MTYTVWIKKETHVFLVQIQSKLIKIKAFTPVCLRTIPCKTDYSGSYSQSFNLHGVYKHPVFLLLWILTANMTKNTWVFPLLLFMVPVHVNHKVLQADCQKVLKKPLPLSSPRCFSLSTNRSQTDPDSLPRRKLSTS